MLDLGSLLQNFQTLVASLEVKVKELLAKVNEANRTRQRFSATSLTFAPNLQYCLQPDPLHVPGLPPAFFLRVCHNVRPPEMPGVVYESIVDRLAGTFATHYFPTTHQFLLQPQHTFRIEAPEAAQKQVGEWSIAVAPSTSVRANESTDTEASVAGESTDTAPFDLSATSSLDDHLVPEDAFDLSDAAYDMSIERDIFLQPPALTSTPPRLRLPPPIPRPRAEGPSRVADAGSDIHYRVVNTTPSGLRRPDISILFQGIPTVENPRVVELYPGLDPAQKLNVVVELPIFMGESKLQSQPEAEKQLFEYAKAFNKETSPDMRFLAFTLRNRGLEVAMFKFAADSTDLVPMLFADGSDWAPVYTKVVHDAMCAFTAEVQTTWHKYGLCWAYEE
ncbi:hypothetical protein C8F01DRAFT_746403 [Mycena amicta]|nr:hypothetical protein C8F01DRAFT_746403 [Mycena amicta]